AAPGPTHRLNAISCVPGSVCVAVGDYTEGTVAQTLVEEGCTSTSSLASPGTSPMVREIGAGTATPGAHCPLNVWFTVLHPAPSKNPATSGLLYYGGDPVFTKAAAPTFDAEYKDTCLSGCVDVQVQVTDPNASNCAAPKLHGQCLVPGATVEASVTEIPKSTTIAGNTTPIIAPYPSGAAAGAGHLCLATEFSVCGTGPNSYITDLKTDGHGQLVLRYWVPGLIAQVTTTITVVASEPCRPEECRSGEKQSDKTSMQVTILPHTVYSGTAHPSVTEVKDLASAAGTGGKFGWNTALNYLKKQLEDKTPLLGDELENLATASFMGSFTPKLPSAGLGTGTASKLGEVELPGTGAYQSFEDALVGPPGNKDIGFDSWSLLYRLGYTLDFANKSSVPQTLTLNIYEVSYCHSGTVCGPGYPEHACAGLGGFTSLGNPTTCTTHEFLYFELSSQSSAFETTFRPSQGGLLTPYNAPQWMTARYAK
ncbi:MAG: hypothetical protein ABSE77_09975, partial [Acidimicrobiales bacterium]